MHGQHGTEAHEGHAFELQLELAHLHPLPWPLVHLGLSSEEAT